MYNSSELRVNGDKAVNRQLKLLIQEYSGGHYDIIIDKLMLLIEELTQQANDNHYSYDTNEDISLCAVCIIDTKYRLGAYQECLDLIQLYKNNNYYSRYAVLPELLRGWCYLVLSRHGLAEEVAKHNLQSSNYNNPEVAASFLFLLGKVRYHLNKYCDARQHYSDSLALFRYTGNVNHSCVVLCALGLVEKDVGRLSKSIEYYNKAYEIVDHSIYRDRAADIRLNKSIALLKHGDSSAALSTIQENFSSMVLPPLLVAKSSIVKARIFLSNHRTEEATTAIRDAMATLTSESFVREEVVCLETCGDIESNISDRVHAELYYNRALQVAKAIDNSTDLVGGVLIRKAALCNNYHDYSAGLEYAKQALALLSSMGLRHDLGITYRVMSESYLGLYNYPVSYKYIMKSIFTLLAHESMKELATSHITAASICIEWHKYYENSTASDRALAALIIESYNMIAFDNRTLYETAWNHALEAHSIYSMCDSTEDVERINSLFEAIKALRQVDDTRTRINTMESDMYDGTTLVAYSKNMKSILSIIEIAANSNEPVLITGETGTGKELVAKLIHEHGSRSDSSFVPVNCAAIPEQLFEREFFGNVKGAFTGADASALGLSDQANGGTLFLDEIGEMPPILQVKLLRLLQDGSFHRLGDPTLRKTNIRVIAATNADISAMVAEKKFRSDCYYRLKTLEIYVPPLRERREDIEPLAALFIYKVLGDNYTYHELFDDDMRELYYKYPWPGNVRELESITRRLALYAQSNKRLSSELLPKYMQIYSKGKMATNGLLHLAAYIENAERERIMQALISSGGSRTCAAANLGISRKSLYAKMRRMNIEFPI
ncbi:MAG: sigma 54-interacting transcriptional regulator [bacterium]|nr:sigma 54-interacting transcriptional regulator [bacterium]